MTSLLLQEEFVAVFPSLVKRLGGMNEAAVLQTIHFTSQISASQDARGVRWVTLTSAQIGRRTGLSDDAVLRALRTMRDMGVLIARPTPRSRTLMWAINIEVLDRDPNRETAVTVTAKTRDPNRENAVCTTTKNIEQQGNNISPLAEKQTHQVVAKFVDRFKFLHSAEPDKASIARLGRDGKRMLAEGRPLEVVIGAAELCADRGHANLPAALTALLAKGSAEPKGFKGIREFLNNEPTDEPH